MQRCPAENVLIFLSGEMHKKCPGFPPLSFNGKGGNLYVCETFPYRPATDGLRQDELY